MSTMRVLFPSSGRSFCSRRRASRSIWSEWIFLSIVSISAGLLVDPILSAEAASSMRSIALSGSLRSGKYRVDMSTAATRAESVIFIAWKVSYLSLMPRRIVRASSRFGSSTITGWKRRSSAASFSMYFRYSLIVVAPMTLIRPRASAGFKRLPASVDPSLAPAPTIVWISSIKRTISPSDFSTSSMTDLSRSSNSPRYFAPAIMAPRSRVRIFFDRSASGTSPLMIRIAIPSTIAVLPTPGSPIRTGLFLLRRARIWMARRISSSRPMTGSIFPFLAWSMRSMVYFFSDS